MRATLPVAPPVAPQQRAPAARAREPQRGGVEHAVRRAVERRRDARRLRDRGLGAVDVLAHLPGVRRSRLRWRWQCRPIPWPAATISPRERGVALDLLADEEERRAHAGAREQLEHRRRALRVRAVVEGERVARAAGRAILDAERRAQRADSAAASPGSR